MSNLNYTNYLPVLRSRLSFQPLIRAWKEQAQNENSGTAKTFLWLLKEVSQHPELLEPIDDFQLLEKHKQLIEQMVATIFPVSTGREKMYAITDPSCYKTVFASDLIKQMLPAKKENYSQGVNDEFKKSLSIAKLKMAYKLILDRFYGIQLAGNITSVWPSVDAETGLNRYMELQLDPCFVDVSCSDTLPALPENLTGCFRLNDILNYPELQLVLPLNEFIFNGIVIVNGRDVTEREAMQMIKTILQNEDFFSNEQQIKEFQEQIRCLVNIRDAGIGITSFFGINNQFSSLKPVDPNNIFLKTLNGTGEKKELLKELVKTFKSSNAGYLFIPELKKNRLENADLLTGIISTDEWASALIFALHLRNEIIGSFEIFSKRTAVFNAGLVPRIEPVIELLELAMRQNSDHFENEVNRIIKEKFTAVHSAVEWKFAEAAVQYFSCIQRGEEPKMEPIVFRNIYPLYGSIDIRNSSNQRNQAIQADLISQLSWAKRILASVQAFDARPLLKETESRIDNFINSLSNALLADEEQKVLNFLNGELAELLHHLQETTLGAGAEIEKYFQSIDPDLHMLNDRRKKFEDSINMINNNLTRFLEREQRDAQNIYPHYFERFVTDGVDFNIYMGQAITPEKKFSDIYLKNIRLWQITTMAIATQRIYRLDASLPVPLQTTQLILVYSKPISISFRSVERKFDVDGGYNARYEVIKKRIDKVHIKNSNERLTEPGTIAIVYSHNDEEEQYLEYIDYLKKQNYITGEMEKFDLEDLPGMTGLKALRIKIAHEETLDSERKYFHQDEKNL